MSEVLIRAENVGKKFCRDLKKSLWYGVKDSANDLLRRKSHESLRKDEFWANQDINFELKRGECLGLVGRNGAGKTTLLKLINGLIKPDTGHITIRGRVGALIALGAGFNPVLTARENIFINGAILGLSRSQINSCFDKIVDFSELNDFVDTPVRNFSSGMKVRLGFAVAVVLVKPELLVLDEVLAVGDAGFRSKCFNAVTELTKSSAVIFVSHAMPQIARLATQVAVMRNGRVVHHSHDPAVGIQAYYGLFPQEANSRSLGDEAQILSIAANDARANRPGGTIEVRCGGDARLALKLEMRDAVAAGLLVLSFFDQEQRSVCRTDCYITEVPRGESEWVVSLPELPLAPGTYRLHAMVCDATKRLPRHLVRYDPLCQVSVTSDSADEYVVTSPILLRSNAAMRTVNAPSG